MKVKLEQSDIQQIAETVTGRIVETLIPIFEDMVKPDELLAKKEVYETMLKCTAKTADELFFSRQDFPCMDLGKGTHLRYSRKAVEKWILENTTNKKELYEGLSSRRDA